MKRSIRLLFWFVVGLALALTIPWLFVGPVSGASVSLGGGQVKPHSYSGAYGLDKGWAFSASLEDLYYENETWGVNVGALYVASHYKRRENQSAYRRHSVESHVAALYTKPFWNLTKHFKPFLVTGLGVNFADRTEPCALAGGGLNYPINENWSLEGKFLYVWDPVKVYQLPTLSIRYEF